MWWNMNESDENKLNSGHKSNDFSGNWYFVILNDITMDLCSLLPVDDHYLKANKMDQNSQILLWHIFQAFK